MTAMIDSVLSPTEPFGPIDTESLLNAGPSAADQLFDRKNLIYEYTRRGRRPTYIIGRKGAGKTAFLLGAPDEARQVRLRTSAIYSDLLATVRHFEQVRTPLFSDQVTDIWHALFDHVALLHGCRTASDSDRPDELQKMWDYLDRPRPSRDEAMAATEDFLSEVHRRIDDTSIYGLREIIDGIIRGGVSFADARKSMRVVLEGRGDTFSIVMDNLEDLHTRLDELRPALSGLFGFIGRSSEVAAGFGFMLQICLPSEMYGAIHEVSANPEKDFRANHLTIYWTATELLHLAGSRLRLFLQTHHPTELNALVRKFPSSRDDNVALLRATLPHSVRGGLDVNEDPVAYLLRHTQLLPRHLIGILNRVYTEPDSSPWSVTPRALRAGTRKAEKAIVQGLFAAHSHAYPLARQTLAKMSDRLDLCFRVNDLHKVFNREGIRKLTGLDFGDFLTMLVDLGVVGVKVRGTDRYNIAEFQYTYDSNLTAEEDNDELCFHPLFTRYLFERALPRLRSTGTLPTYPFGCDLDRDYRRSLGYPGI